MPTSPHGGKADYERMNPVLRWFHQLGSPPTFDRFAARWAPWCHAIALALVVFASWRPLRGWPPRDLAEESPDVDAAPAAEAKAEAKAAVKAEAPAADDEHGGGGFHAPSIAEFFPDAIFFEGTNFEINRIHNGTYKVRAILLGFDCKPQQITLAQGETEEITLSLQQKASQISEVEVFGIRDKQPEKLERPETLAEQLAFKSRFVLVFGEINHNVARTVCEKLIALSQQSDAPIRVLISSPGGHVESGDAIHDMIRFINAPVTTIGTGWVASAGTHIFLAAEKQHRVCLPNTRFMIHQPGGGAGGPAADIAIQAKEILSLRERLNKILAENCGQPVERIELDTERDNFMAAEDAVAYGLIDKVMNTRDE
mgnify:CR=1 FL=1